MKCLAFLIVTMAFLMSGSAQDIVPNFGLSKTEKGWFLTVWSSKAEQMQVLFYDESGDLEPFSILNMAGEEGVWTVKFSEDYLKKFYTVRSMVSGKWMEEVVEPYARLVSVNGNKAYVEEATSIVPEGWQNDKFIAVSPAESIIYEIQIRDFSMGCESCFEYQGKFLAFTEEGVHLGDRSVGLDHIVELGVTHVHLLPAFDFRSIDESKLYEQDYNWGYDPLNYNVPEGSFSTDPFSPEVRVMEFKKMVMALHNAGIGVVMDVVYNHTGPTEGSSFNQLDPGYYYRMIDGKFSNASACGNETASEKDMMRQFMIESMSYWMEEYHVDGFRVDLMGIHDIETMNQVQRRLSAINPNVLLYGEGWAAGDSPLDESLRALKHNTSALEDIAVFSDEFRDGLKGHWNTHSDRGFVTGKAGQKENLKFGLVGGVLHSDIQYDQVNYTDSPWTDKPSQMVSYISCHDGMTLADKLRYSYPGLSDAQYLAKQKLAATFILTSQGVPFLHAGFEFLRSKYFIDNSFESSDTINAIDWSLKAKNLDMVAYTQALISMRNEHMLFKLGDRELMETTVSFPETNDELLLVYQIDGTDLKDQWKESLILFNGDLQTKNYQLPEGEWYYEVRSGNLESGTRLDKLQIEIASSSASILYQLHE